MNGEFKYKVTWREAILESIFRPEMVVGGGRAEYTHLHPNLDKLHLPPDIYLSDWRKYRVQDHQILVNFQKKCHANGLHDPWLRNYACGLYPSRRPNRSITRVVTRYMGWGFCAATVLYAIEMTYLKLFPITYDHSPEYIAKYGTGELH